MKKSISLILAVFMVATAHAEWKPLIKGAGGTVFIDSSRPPAGPLTNRTVWIAADFDKPNEYGEMSMVALWEIDCTRHLARIRKSMTYTEAGRQGREMEGVVNPPPFGPAEGFGATVATLVCPSPR